MAICEQCGLPRYPNAVTISGLACTCGQWRVSPFEEYAGAAKEMVKAVQKLHESLEKRVERLERISGPSRDASQKPREWWVYERPEAAMYFGITRHAAIPAGSPFTADMPARGYIRVREVIE